MKLVYMRSSPLSNIKVNVQQFEDVKKMANSYVYSENDRIKKICNKKDQRLQHITEVNCFPNTKPHQYQIILINPTQEKISKVKKQLLQIAKKQIQQIIDQYTVAIEKIDKNLNKI